MRFQAYLLLTVLVLLAGCTGTREERLPTLLVVGSAVGDQGLLTLFEDLYDPAAGTPRSLVPVAGSERDLPAPPVSLDFVERATRRSPLAVLTIGGGNAQVHLFATTDLDPAVPTGFAPLGPPIDLAAVLAGATPTADLACLVEIQVTELPTGNIVAALLEADDCGDDIPQLHLVDLTESDYLESLDDPLLLDAGIFIDQADDRLYYVVDVFGETRVQSLALTSGSEASLGQAGIDLRTAQQTDFAPVSGGFALLADGRLAVVPLGSGPGSPIPALDTLSGATRVLSDPLRALDEVVVTSPTRVAVHPVATEPERFDLTVSGLVAATLEPADRFAYLLGQDQVFIVDLIPRDSAQPYALEPFGVDVTGTPTVIEWLYAGGLPELP